MSKTLLSFGHGYTSNVLARHLVEDSWTVFGTTRKRENFSDIEATGVQPILWPGGDVRRALSSASHILICTGPNDKGDPVLNALRDEIASVAPGLEWAGYLSTTGVYGDHQGGWVDEATALAPSTKRGNLRVSAEAAWQELAQNTGLPLHIFRLAGIYGPGRGPFAKVRAGTARRIVKPGQVFSRIHVEDIAKVLVASINKPNPGSIYNVCDDDPAPPEDVMAYAAELLGQPVPSAVRFEDADLTPMARSFYAESKRVRNGKIKEELDVTLDYPNYRVGLKSLLATH